VLYYTLLHRNESWVKELKVGKF